MIYFIQQIKRILQYLENSCLFLFNIPPRKPISLVIGITNTCNLQCEFCFHHPSIKSFIGRKKGIMTLDLFKKILKEIKGKVHHVELGLFGEPFLHPQIINFLELLSKNKTLVSVFTNGVNLGDAQLKALVSTAVSSITFSIDGSDDAEYAKLRGTDKIHQVYENINKLQEIKKLNKSSLPKIFIRSLSIHNDAKQEKQALIKRFNHLDYDQLIIAPKDNWSGEDIKVKEAGKTKIELCNFPWQILAIDWDGRVTPCCEDFLGKNEVGNINNQTLSDAWKGERISQIRTSLKSCHLSEISNNTGCKDCSILKRSPHPLSFKLQLIRSTLSEMMGHLYQ
jgi:radical SAM protein with 4Fe4S-binding SPASM domain